jgi:hypothetical protein
MPGPPLDLSHLSLIQRLLFWLLNLIFRPGSPTDDEQLYEVHRDRNFFLALGYGQGQNWQYHTFMHWQGHSQADAARSFRLYTSQRYTLILVAFFTVVLIAGMAKCMLLLRLVLTSYSRQRARSCA